MTNEEISNTDGSLHVVVERTDLFCRTIRFRKHILYGYYLSYRNLKESIGLSASALPISIYLLKISFTVIFISDRKMCFPNCDFHRSVTSRYSFLKVEQIIDERHW